MITLKGMKDEWEMLVINALGIRSLVNLHNVKSIGIEI